MATWFIASKLSPFSSSLLTSAPSILPSVPTLAELQKHAESARSIVVDSLPSFPANPMGRGVVASTREPPPAVSISHSVRQPVRPWFTSPPPPYVQHPPAINNAQSAIDAQKGKTLKKGRMGWKRLQGKIPDEDVDVDVIPRMSGSRVYVGSQGRYDRMQEVQVEKEQGKTFWEWITCR